MNKSCRTIVNKYLDSNTIHLNSVPDRQSFADELPTLPQRLFSAPKTLQIFINFECHIWQVKTIICNSNWREGRTSNFVFHELDSNNFLLVLDLVPCRASDQWQAMVHAGTLYGGRMWGSYECLKYSFCSCLYFPTVFLSLCKMIWRATWNVLKDGKNHLLRLACISYKYAKQICISSSCLIKYTSSFTESMPDHIYDGAMPQLWKKNTISDGGSTTMQKSYKCLGRTDWILFRKQVP